MKDETICTSWFNIESSGKIENMIGFVSNKNSYFNPDGITQIIGIQPFETKEMGNSRPHGNGKYPFSSWSACKQIVPELNAQQQCIEIVRKLRPYIEKLNRIKKMYNVNFSIIVEAQIYNEECPYIGFDKEVIEFCFETGTEIIVNPIVYGKD